MNPHLYLIMFQRELINSSCALCAQEFTIFRHFLVKLWRLYIHLFCTHGTLFGTHHKLKLQFTFRNSKNYTILTDVYNMSQFSILGKFYVSMALILSLVSGFCEGRNVSEPSLNSFCPLNPLFPTSTHVEQNVTSCLESCTEFLCTSVFSSLWLFG